MRKENVILRCRRRKLTPDVSALGKRQSEIRIQCECRDRISQRVGCVVDLRLRVSGIAVVQIGNDRRGRTQRAGKRRIACSAVVFDPQSVFIQGTQLVGVDSFTWRMVIHINVVAARVIVQIGMIRGRVQRHCFIPTGTIEITVSALRAGRNSLTVAGIDGRDTVDSRSLAAIIGGIKKHVIAARAVVEIHRTVAVKLGRISTIRTAVALPPGYCFSADTGGNSIARGIAAPMTVFNCNGFAGIGGSRIAGQRIAHVDIVTASVLIEVLIDPCCVMRIVMNRVVGIGKRRATGKAARLALALRIIL